MDTELLLVSGGDSGAVMGQLRQLAERAGGVAFGALATECAERLDASAPVRVGVVARNAHELRAHLGQLEVWSRDSAAREVRRDPRGAAFWCDSAPASPPRVGFLYPGHGCQRLDMGRALVDSFPWARLMLRSAEAELARVNAPAIGERMYRPAVRPAADSDDAARFEALSHVEVAGPAIIFTSALWTRYLEILGVRPVAVAGHSQGEQAAFHAAGVLDLPDLMALSAFMGRAGSPRYNPAEAGAMTVFACPIAVTEALIDEAGGYAVIAAHNGPEQAVVAGERAAVDRAAAAATERGIEVHALPVSNAFHTRLVAEGGRYMKSHCPSLPPVAATRALLVSSLTGEPVAAGTPPVDHFVGMVTAPIHFDKTIRALAGEVDLLIELGAGQALSGMVRAIDPALPCFPIEPKPGHTRALHSVAAALFAYGAPVKWPLFFRTARKAWGGPHR